MVIEFGQTLASPATVNLVEASTLGARRSAAGPITLPTISSDLEQIRTNGATTLREIIVALNALAAFSPRRGGDSYAATIAYMQACALIYHFLSTASARVVWRVKIFASTNSRSNMRLSFDLQLRRRCRTVQQISGSDCPDTGFVVEGKWQKL
jgi:hypothetical protein